MKAKSDLRSSEEILKAERDKVIAQIERFV